MTTATLTSKGQITVPKEIRDKLHLEQGDVLRFELLPSGELRVTSGKPGPSVYGMLRKYAKAKALTVREIDEAIGRHVALDDQRIRRGR